MEIKQNHGGKRTGAGRPSLNGPTKTLTFRIPLADIKALQSAGVTNISRFYVEVGAKAIKRLKKTKPQL